MLSSGGTYVGDLDTQLRRHGQGTYTYSVGGMGQFRYEGAWHRGQKHGLGVLYLGDGSTIEATFMDGEISGQGLRRWPDGRTYTGNFHNGELHGEGTMVTSDGSTYSGEYRNNRRHGAGELRETKLYCFEIKNS